jgi:aspartate dehydrogenase
VLTAVIIGFGGIGQEVCKRLQYDPSVNITHVVVRAEKCEETQRFLDAHLPHIKAVTAIPEGSPLVVECAGHQAIHDFVLPALCQGIECAIVSIGALAESLLAEKLISSAQEGHTQVHLLSGAIAGIDALASAKLAGLSEVTYTGRKPPLGWKGTAAEGILDLNELKTAQTFFEGSARDAASLYPKNANVAATLSLAGLGLDETRVKLIADPTTRDNIHHLLAKGDFGEFELTMRGIPLPSNPKTSTLTVLSVLRFLKNKTALMVI